MTASIKKWLVWKVLLVCGVVCMAYFAAITAYVGYLNAFNIVWIAAGIFLVTLYKIRIRAANFICKTSKIFKASLLVIMAGFVVSAAVVENLIIQHAKDENADNAHCLIILGAGLNNGKPSKTLARRINTGAAYLKQDTALHAVVCGGRGFLEEVTEAQVMADLLQQSGIAAHRIMMEDSSKNTYENLLYSQKFVDINAKIVIVTSEFHLFRAKRIAKKAGYKNIGGIASKTPLLLLPTCYAREYFAVVKALIFSDI